MTESSPLTSPATVCVTGASGFIALHLVQQLLEAGHRVHGTVRSLANENKLQPLRSLPGANDRLLLFEADLMADGSFDQAVAGCDTVFHTASPYVVDVQDAQRDLVEPAVRGTRTVLESCARDGGVRRVVLTSSVAAITDEPDDDKVFNEEDWNRKSSLKRNPYYFSKTLAERAAWDFVQYESPFDLVVINPFMVIGPALSPALNESHQVFTRLFAGEFPGILALNWGMVNVRDVARAHVLAMEKPNAAGRYLCCADVVTMERLVSLLRDWGFDEGAKLPRLKLDGTFGNLLVRLVSYTKPRGTGSYLRSHIGCRFRVSNDKIRGELGVKFRPIEQSLRDTFDDLRRWGHLPSPSSER